MGRTEQLPENLPHLQNLIKRDPEAYYAEFLQQYRRYESNLQVFLLQPSENSKVLADLIIFIAQVSSCFSDVVKSFPQQLCDVLSNHAAVLFPDIRMVLCRALILLRKKRLVAPGSIYELFFELFRCQDKTLREFLFSFIVKDIRLANKKCKRNSLNKSMQNHMYTLLTDSNSTVVYMSLKIMVELYQRKVWNDAKTVNVISNACFSKFPKVLAIALKFFLGNDRTVIEESDDEDDALTPRDIILRYQTGRKTTRNKLKYKKQLKKARQEEQKKKPVKKLRNTDFSAIHQIHDPDGFADRLYQKLQKSTGTFEIRLMMIMVLGRVIGVHKLFLFNFYPFLQRFIQPYQREVTKILLSLAQASHELVPPEIIRDSIMTIANNFVTERNSSEVMAVGLNTIREICSRCPLAMTDDILRDLTQYQRKQGKPVVAAARSLVLLYRKNNPTMLHKKDRGKFTQATKELAIASYGEVVTRDYIPGSEILQDFPDVSMVDQNIDGWEECSDESNSDGSWIDVSSDEETNAMIAASLKKTTTKEENEIELPDVQSMTEEEKMEKSKQLSKTRIFTPADFELINAHQDRKEVVRASRKNPVKRKFSDMEEENTEGGEILPIGNIEHLAMKKRRDKEERMAAVLAAKMDKPKKTYGSRKINPVSSSTNKIKLKKKPFMMVKPKMFKKTTGRSFREKQIALRNSLLKKAKSYKFK